MLRFDTEISGPAFTTTPGEKPLPVRVTVNDVPPFPIAGVIEVRVAAFPDSTTTAEAPPTVRDPVRGIPETFAATE